jgi:hypothetical protein
MQRNQKIILDQKKMRLEKRSELERKEIREIEIKLKNLRNDMNKLNGLLHNHKSFQDNLYNDNFNMENEFVQRLKELENETLRLENLIQELKDEKVKKSKSLN